MTYFMQAHEAYHEWGAVAKSKALCAYVQSARASASYNTPAEFSLANGHRISEDKKNQRKRGTGYN